MAKKILIENCRMCPHHRYKFMGPSKVVCILTDAHTASPPRDILSAREIQCYPYTPTWCPLEDAE